MSKTFKTVFKTYSKVKVVDKNGDTVSMGMPGEVWFKGYNVMPCYWNDEEMTKKAIVNGEWLRSGYDDIFINIEAI